MRLYELAEELQALDILWDEYAAENDGDVTDFPLQDELKLLEEKREEMLLNLGAWRKDILKDVAGHKEEAKSQTKKAKVGENKAERITEFIAYNMTVGEKLKDSKCDIGWRKSSRLIIDVPVEDLPKEYKRTKIEADKTALKAHIKTANDCTYAHMEEHLNLQIK